MESSMEKKKIHKNDIRKLEDKIKKLDREIRETEKIRNEVHRSNSISTHETEMDSENSYLINPIPERKSMPNKNIKSTLGHVRGIITHMVDLVNQDPSVNSSLTSELSSLVKFRARMKKNQRTPDALKNIEDMSKKTPEMLETVQNLRNEPRKLRK